MKQKMTIHQKMMRDEIDGIKGELEEWEVDQDLVKHKHKEIADVNQSPVKKRFLKDDALNTVLGAKQDSASPTKRSRTRSLGSPDKMKSPARSEPASPMKNSLDGSLEKSIMSSL